MQKDIATEDVPKAYNESIGDYGGQNPYGQPNWRISLAEKCLVETHGTVVTMPDVDSVWEFDKDGRPHARHIVPEDIICGDIWAPKYPVEGWILEKWFPASAWGTREAWESATAKDPLRAPERCSRCKLEQQDSESSCRRCGLAFENSSQGTRLLGEYPARGDYFMLAGPWDEIPPISSVEGAIQEYMRAMANRPRNLALYMKQMLAEANDERQKRIDQHIRQLSQFRKSEVQAILASPSLAAQRTRNNLAAMLGVRGHLSAGDFTLSQLPTR